jgi:hypothetical protein
MKPGKIILAALAAGALAGTAIGGWQLAPTAAEGQVAQDMGYQAVRAALAVPVGRQLPACNLEDGSGPGQMLPCYWDATSRGNGEGRSYTVYGLATASTPAQEWVLVIGEDYRRLVAERVGEQPTDSPQAVSARQTRVDGLVGVLADDLNASNAWDRDHPAALQRPPVASPVDGNAMPGVTGRTPAQSEIVVELSADGQLLLQDLRDDAPVADLHEHWQRMEANLTRFSNT